MNHASRLWIAGLSISAFLSLPVASQEGPIAPGATLLNVNEAKALFDRGAKFADVRLEEVRHARGHIPRSLELGTKFDIDPSRLLKFARKDEAVIFYCDNRQCANAYYAAVTARKLGYVKVYQLGDGFDEWKAKGLPVDGK